MINSIKVNIQLDLQTRSAKVDCHLNGVDSDEIKKNQQEFLDNLKQGINGIHNSIDDAIHQIIYNFVVDGIIDQENIIESTKKDYEDSSNSIN